MQSGKLDKNRMRRLREEAELTTTELAALVSVQLGRTVHQSTISKYENGARQPRSPMFGALCRVFRVPKSYLLIPTEQQPAADTAPLNGEPSKQAS